MAISTHKTFLMTKKDESSWSKLIDIKSFPDLGGSPEMLETTTLSDPAQTYIPGIQSSEALEFTANYTLADYKKIEALKGQELDLALWFGGTESPGSIGKEGLTPTGSEGKHEFKGYVFAHTSGGGTNEVVGLAITIIPSTPIKEVSETE